MHTNPITLAEEEEEEEEGEEGPQHSLLHK